MKDTNQLSPLSLAILGLVAQQPQSGYDLRKAFSTTPMGHFSSSPGAIYPALKRIERSGWVRGRVEAKTALRPRMVYKITKKGLGSLRRHLSQPVAVDDVIWHMDDLMLRFAFMDPIVGRERTVQFLHEFRAAVEEHVRSLKEFAATAAGQMPPCGRLAMEQGIETYEIQARWAKRAIEELAGGS